MNAPQSDLINRADVGALVLAAALLHVRSAKFSNPDPAYSAGLLAGLEVVAAGVGLVELTGELTRLLTPGGER